MFLSGDTQAQSHYARVPTISHPRNGFSIAKRHLTTIQFDKLFPMYVKYIYPGDTLAIQHHMMARLQTQVSDLFDDLYFDLHAWFVPMRLLQKNWANYQFNTQDTPAQDNSALQSPRLNLTTLPGVTKKFPAKSLFDYMGYPTDADYTASSQHINVYAPLAYNLIWNTNYRDENLQNPVAFDPTLTTYNYSDFNLLYRGRRHDKFTSSLPWVAKGILPVVPINGTAPITGIGKKNGDFSIANASARETNGTTQTYTIASNIDGTAATNNEYYVLGSAVNNGYPRIFANLTAGLSYLLLNDFRTTASVQQLLEADARGGTRDVESIKHRWGVQVPDFRMQRPEYLGGQTFSFDGHVVPSTAETATNPQAHLTSFSQAMNTFNVTHSFVEHGIFMILVSCRSNLTYQQTLNREFSYQTRYDWYQPEFANVGEIAVKNKERRAIGTDLIDNAAYGYQEYAYWMRYDDNMVTAEMRSSYPQSLDYKHMAFDEAGLPPLNGTNIQSYTPIDRNIVVASDISDPIQINSLVKGTIARTLPMYSVPGLTRI